MTTATVKTTPPDRRAERIRARRHTVGASLGALPVSNLVLMEAGLALGLIILAIDPRWLPVGAAVFGLTIILALIRWRGRWFTQWFPLITRYGLRASTRTAHREGLAVVDRPAEDDEDGLFGPEDRRVALLRLVVPDLVIAHGLDHDRQHVGFAWHAGRWTAVLQVDPGPRLVTPLGVTPNLPLSALVPCLSDRGVVLHGIQAIWHCYPGGTALPPDAPAMASYLDVLGPLPAAARRTTWLAVTLDPRTCAKAVHERGGGVVGAHRALIGALNRIRNAMGAHGVNTTPLDADQLMRAGISAAELTSVAGDDNAVHLRERWKGVTAGGIGHAGYAVTSWPRGFSGESLDLFTGVRALSTTLALTIFPGSDPDRVGLRGLIRVSARDTGELVAAEKRLIQLSGRIGTTLTPLRGMQAEALAATLPLGGAA